MTLETIEQTRLSEPTREESLEEECNSLRERLDASEAQAAAWQARAIEAGQKYDSLAASVRTGIVHLARGIAAMDPMAYMPTPAPVSTEYEALTCEDLDIEF